MGNKKSFLDSPIFNIISIVAASITIYSNFAVTRGMMSVSDIPVALQSFVMNNTVKLVASVVVLYSAYKLLWRKK